MRDHFRTHALAMFLIGLLMSTGAEASDRLEIDGFVKNYSSAVNPPEIGNDRSGFLNQPVLGSVSNRIRINGRYRPADWLTFRSSYDLVPQVRDRSLGSTGALTAALDPSRYRAVDLDRRLYPAEGKAVGSFSINQNLDRAVLSVAASGFDLYLGRQAIAWGSAHAVNPTDIIAPYAFSELDTEDRIGVDAVRLRIPLGNLGELDAGYVAGEDLEWNRSAVFLRGKYYLLRTDVSAMLVGFRDNLMLGLDLSRAVGGAGVWFEGAQVFVKALDNDCEKDGRNDYFRASFGADYAFGSITYGFVEYHVSTAGANNPDRYAANLLTAPYAEGSVYLMGRHYLITGGSYQLSPLVMAFGEALVNLSDGSVLLAPSIEYNIAENIYLAAGAFVGLGKNSEVSEKIEPGSLPLDIGSEFGFYSDIYFTSFRVYF